MPCGLAVRAGSLETIIEGASLHCPFSEGLTTCFAVRNRFDVLDISGTKISPLDERFSGLMCGAGRSVLRLLLFEVATGVAYRGTLR